MAEEAKQDVVATEETVPPEGVASENVALAMMQDMQIRGDERASSETTPTTPSRTTSGSGSGGSSGRNKGKKYLTEAERKFLGKDPTPGDLKKQKERLEEELKQVNE